MTPRSIAPSMTAKAPPRVMLLLGALNGGGAERIAVDLFNSRDLASADLRLALLARVGHYLAEVNPRRVVSPAHDWSGLLGFARAPADIAWMIRRLRPQVLMSFGMGVNLLTWLALRGLGRERPRWICREDSNPVAEIAHLTRSRLGRSAIAGAVAHAYRSADRLLCGCHDQARHLAGRLAIPAERIVVAPNPIDLARIARAAREPLAGEPRRPFVVTAGRLAEQKDHQLLIDAFAASRACRELDLVILGEGPLESALRARAQALGVGARVLFPGFQANPWAWFARARLFVLASRWAGFGSVVAEAMACGAPVVVNDCDFGPREQVIHGRSGWVAPAGDAAALTVSLDTLIRDPELSARLAAGGRARAVDFEVGAVARTYAALFVELADSATTRTSSGQGVSTALVPTVRPVVSRARR
ncbi:MAG: glycosyltransferase [Caulobacteraceae bacterium]